MLCHNTAHQHDQRSQLAQPADLHVRLFNLTVILTSFLSEILCFSDRVLHLPCLIMLTLVMELWFLMVLLAVTFWF